MECKSLRESGEKIKAYDVAFFGASCDQPEKNKEFADKLDLNFPLLSDPSKKVAKEYGILMGDRFSKRVTVFVDKNGKIAHVEDQVNVRKAGQQVVDILEKLKSENTTKKAS